MLAGPATVLVVHDGALVADDLRRSLETLGYRVAEEVAPRSQAAACASGVLPALVVLDARGAGGPRPESRAPSEPSADARWTEAAAEVRAVLGTPTVLVRPASAEAPFRLVSSRDGDLHASLSEPIDPPSLASAIAAASALARRSVDLAARAAAAEQTTGAVLASVRDGVFLLDPSDRIARMNAAAEAIAAVSSREAVGRPFADLVSLREAAPRAEPLDAGDRDAPSARLIARTSGSAPTVEGVTTPIRGENGAPLGKVVVLRDVAERRKLEQRLAQSERLASIGAMAAGMAHEINNPLAYVITNLGVAVEGLLDVIQKLPEKPGGSPGPQLRELVDALREANEGAERVRRIVLDLKKFGRVDEGSVGVIDVREVLDAAAKITANAVRHHARLRKAYGIAPLVEANEGQLTQVFTNILMNAAQAFGEGEAERHEIVITTRTDPAGRAVIEVRDNGPGIPPEVLPRIFEPFFTSKAAGGGMGLGLAICQNIVAALGGEIGVESSRDAGTTVRVALPATRTSSTRTRAAQPLPEPVRRGRVLVIDDEAAVANSIARMLRAQHDVVVETEPRRALSRLASGEGYDVVFCDLMMPSMSGIDLYRTLATSVPDQAKRIVFMTGGAFSPRSQAFLENVGNVSVAKPFTIQAIRAIVSDYLRH